MRPVCTTDPSPICEPTALSLPALIPRPAFFEMYLTIEVDVALIESYESLVSSTTHDENCRVGVRTPAIIGVGNEI